MSVWREGGSSQQGNFPKRPTPAATNAGARRGTSQSARLRAASAFASVRRSDFCFDSFDYDDSFLFIRPTRLTHISVRLPSEPACVAHACMRAFRRPRFFVREACRNKKQASKQASCEKRIGIFSAQQNDDTTTRLGVLTQISQKEKVSGLAREIVRERERAVSQL